MLKQHENSNEIIMKSIPHTFVLFDLMKGEINPRFAVLGSV